MHLAAFIPDGNLRGVFQFCFVILPQACGIQGAPLLMHSFLGRHPNQQRFRLPTGSGSSLPTESGSSPAWPSGSSPAWPPAGRQGVLGAASAVRALSVEHCLQQFLVYPSPATATGDFDVHCTCDQDSFTFHALQIGHSIATSVCNGVEAPLALLWLGGPPIASAANPARGTDGVRGSPGDPPVGNRPVEGGVVVIRARGSGGQVDAFPRHGKLTR